jgi:cell division initiation protein
MALTPLDIQKMRFPQKMRGFDPTEVESFLALVAEELAAKVSALDKAERENRYYRQRLEETEQREHQLQQTLLRAQKVSDEITANARREAELMVKEAEIAADKMVQQAVEQSTRIESKISELRTMRRELQMKFRNTLDLFQRILEAEMEEERPRSTPSPGSGKRRDRTPDPHLYRTGAPMGGVLRGRTSARR